MSRVCLLVLDSVGIGGAADARHYGDHGANTLGHIADACANGLADDERCGCLHLPNLASLGLGLAAELASGTLPAGLALPQPLRGVYSCAREISLGKDTPSGHFEMLGAPVLSAWGSFDAEPPIPEELLNALVRQAHLPGILGNCRMSGTDILTLHGMAHLASAKPIIYTSVDSVLQIAAHEDAFGLERLYEVCRIARKLVDVYGIARVIARPFVGQSPVSFRRTGNRKDFSSPPPGPTVLDRIVNSGGEVWGVGKIGDIFAHQGVTREIRASGLDALMDETVAAWMALADNSLLLTNFVDFDSVYGHRRDVCGYVRALEYFDARMPELLDVIGTSDLLLVTADHGCDPTWIGTDHTREQVPALLFSPGLVPGSAGRRETFADIGATIADFLGVPGTGYGRTMLQK